ncbi:hypothetical protein BT69DRAFT_1284143 [Atractiella rhizophila]|nr:hypothetical protein BT69DRAFT_1284143 [Atractiella rhizophila]
MVLVMAIMVAEFVLLLRHIILCIPDDRRLSLSSWANRSDRAEERFHNAEHVMKKLIRDPSFDLNAAEKLRFKAKVEWHLQTCNQSHITFFRWVRQAVNKQLNHLSRDILRSLPSESPFGLQKAAGILDYSVADVIIASDVGRPRTFEEWLATDEMQSSLKDVIKVALFSDALPQGIGNAVKGSILRLYRKEMGEDVAEGSHLYDLPYLSRGWSKLTAGQHDTLLIRCATLCLDIDAPTSTSAYYTLLASPILNHEQSIPPEAAELRQERIVRLFGHDAVMGEWKNDITNLKDQVSLSI